MSASSREVPRYEVSVSVSVAHLLPLASFQGIIAAAS